MYASFTADLWLNLFHTVNELTERGYPSSWWVSRVVHAISRDTRITTKAAHSFVIVVRDSLHIVQCNASNALPHMSPTPPTATSPHMWNHIGILVESVCS